MHSASRPYRSKTIKPCDACRKRRTACIRNEGDTACSLCRHRQAECTFLTAPKARKDAKRRTSQSSKSPSTTQNMTGAADQALSTVSSDTNAFAPADMPFTPIQMDDIDLSFLNRIDPRYLVTEKQLDLNSEDWFNSSTSVPDRTFFYSGSSSDQGPYLLRHLVYDNLGCFGDDRWLIWRVAAQGEPAYLTSFPNHHLDSHAAMYAQVDIESLFAPFQDELIDLYFTYVNPSYPIIGSKASFLRKRAEGTLPASFLAVVFLHAANFWHLSPHTGVLLPDNRALQPYIFSCLAFESRTPNIAVVQTCLLFMQLVARINRAPNQPAIWPMTSMCMGMAQDIGLHIEPSSWNITHEERRTRRILWWAVFIHDKMMCHSLGRPSHVTANSWNVEPLRLGDFADEDGRMEVESIASSNSFIALANLSLILSDLLEDFYGVRSNFQTMSGELAMHKGKTTKEKLKHWKETHGMGLGSNTQPFHYTVHFAALTVELSASRAVLGSAVSFDQQTDLIGEVLHSVTHLLPVLDSLIQYPVTGLWLTYNRSGFSLIGSLLISLVLSSITDTALDERRTALFDFRSRLQLLVNEYTTTRCFDFARLPLKRINLIIEELFRNYDGATAASGSSPTFATSPDDDSEHKIWASYRIAYP